MRGARKGQAAPAAPVQPVPKEELVDAVVREATDRIAEELKRHFVSKVVDDALQDALQEKFAQRVAAAVLSALGLNTETASVIMADRLNGLVDQAKHAAACPRCLQCFRASSRPEGESQVSKADAQALPGDVPESVRAYCVRLHRPIDSLGAVEAFALDEAYTLAFRYVVSLRPGNVSDADIAAVYSDLLNAFAADATVPDKSPKEFYRRAPRYFDKVRWHPEPS